MYFLGFIKASCSMLTVPADLFCALSWGFVGVLFDGAGYLSLHALRSFPAPPPPPHPVSAVTPLEAEQFAWELRLHPQRPQVNFVLDGIRHEFKLGFVLPKSSSPLRRRSLLLLSMLLSLTRI